MASYCFRDWETQSNADLTVVGSLAYVLDESTRPLLLSWAIDDGPVKLWCPSLDGELVPEVLAYVKSRMTAYGASPVELHHFFAKPGHYAVGWNEGFDRQVHQQIATPDYGFPRIDIEQTLDAMAQASASNLPGKLDWAGRMLGLGTKTIGGSAIMKRFADRHLELPGSPADIVVMTEKLGSRDKVVAEAILLWTTYLDYSVQDTVLLRDVWQCTRPLDAEEWREYWAFERINDKGMMVDLDVCRGAVEYREEEGEYVEAECARLTDGAILKPTLTQQINQWLYAQLPEDLGSLMVKERDENGAVVKLTAAKPVLTRLLEDINDSDTPPPDNVVEFIELLQFGRSSSAVKFQKILNQAVDDRLCNSYVFNGAGQTGRGSSRGVQIHNLPRDVVPNELDVLDMVVARVPIGELRALPLTKADLKKSNRPPTSVNALLARLIRPTFIAPEGKVLVWGDWAAIEARVTPWLANTRGAEEAVLIPFRESDADENKPDIYILNAADIFSVDAQDLWARYKADDPQAYAMRQAGKVAVLALGFLGGVGALRAMARGYGMRLSNEEAQKIVDGWRDRNRWARKFGDKCEEAAFHAMNAPLAVFEAGRLRYQFLPDLMGGSLACFLPDLRPLLYPMAEIKKIERFGKERDTITYLNGMGRRSLWNGLQVENGTQGLAASILRGTLVRLEEEEPDTIIGHTHDEVIGEVDATMASGFAERLESVMVRGFDWTEGLPLAAEVKTDWYYHK